MALLFLLVSCVRTPTPPPPPVVLTISGSTAMVPLLGQLAEGFQARQPGATVVVEGDGAAWGLARVAEGATEPSTEDQPEGRSRPRLAAVAGQPPEGMWAAPIAADSIAVVVHADHPLEDLTLAQLHEVFYGRVWQWSELGVQVTDSKTSEAEVLESEVTVVSREEGSGTRAVFEALVMTQGQDCQPISEAELGGTSSGPPPCEADPVTSTAVMMLDSAAVVQFVAEHPGAIGYVAHGHLSPGASDAPRVKALQIEGVPPTPEHVADGSYRLSLPYFLVAPDEPTGVARQFVDFCLSAEGQAIVVQRYVPLRSE